MNFENKVVLITGASTGIGKELAITLSKVNCKIILVARRVDLIEKLVDEISHQSKAEFLTLKCDVSKKEEVAEAYKKSTNKFGRIDVAILNAGFGENMQVEEYNSELAETTFGANVFGIIYWVEQLLPDFLKRQSGYIVGISSLADNRGFSESGFYCASKAASSIYLEGLSVELKRQSIKVITVKPGFVKTPMTDKNDFEMPLLMEADKAAKIIVTGIEKEKRNIQFPFPIVLVTKLIGLLPNWLYEFFASKK
ncbi:MAG: SDR family NAD(P)-dependent oxidoreductase [Ignavibacteriae bacterium]|nr:SDR family NAD(P)-dependent oxidoreductase [Ignavibacteriota bacterium]